MEAVGKGKVKVKSMGLHVQGSKGRLYMQAHGQERQAGMSSETRE